MSTWAGVQKVSRPIERCHEISQWIPVIAQVTAATEHQTYHGTDVAFERETGAGMVVAKTQLNPCVQL